jgi:hypothetical protein
MMELPGAIWALHDGAAWCHLGRGTVSSTKTYICPGGSTLNNQADR